MLSDNYSKNRSVCKKNFNLGEPLQWRLFINLLWAIVCFLQCSSLSLPQLLTKVTWKIPNLNQCHCQYGMVNGEK